MSFSLLSILATSLFAVLLISLHFIKPELNPSWRFISEYAIGSWGWLMKIAFFSWAMAYFALFVALRRHLFTKLGKAGLISLLISASGLIIAGIYTTDPVTSDAVTLEGQLHGLGGTLGIAMPVAAWCVGFSVSRISPIGSTWVRFSTFLAVGAAVFSMVSLGIMLSSSGGKVTPEVPVGIPTRLEVVGYCVWLLATGWKVNTLMNAEGGIAERAV